MSQWYLYIYIKNENENEKWADTGVKMYDGEGTQQFVKTKHFHH